jgi:hypothetical protein
MIWADSNINLMKGKLYGFRAVKDCVDYLLGSLKVFVRNSKKYLDWREAQKPILEEQAKVWFEKYKRFGVRFPLNNVSVKVYHYWADNQERDLTNKLDSLTDLLVDSGIIVNDNWQYLRQIHSESENYHGQILDHITRIDVTQSYYD